MPISSGANRWPKSYWTKPQPREISVRVVKVAERPSVRRTMSRNMSGLSSAVNVPSKPDFGLQSEPSPPATSGGTVSDAEAEGPPLRSPGAAAVPLLVERSVTDRQDNGGERRDWPQRPVQQPRHVASCSATVAETSSSTGPPKVRTGWTSRVSPALL